MYFLDVFVWVDRAEPVDGQRMEVAEAKVEIHIGKDEERVDDYTLVDEERVVEGVRVEVVIVGVHVSALWEEEVDDEENWEGGEDWDEQA